MKRRRSYLPVITVSLMLLLQSACGAAAPEITPTVESLPAATSTEAPLPTPTPTLTPTSVPRAYPPPRGFHTMVYDTESDSVLLFSGSPNEFTEYDDAWMYKTSINTWTQLPSIFKANICSAYDSKADRVFIYASLAMPGDGTRHWIGDIYTYNLNQEKLEQLPSKTTPVGHHGSQMVYDAESDRFILFGGWDMEHGYYDETWSYDLKTNTWKNMQPVQHPSGRTFHSMVYIPTIDRVLLFGGGTDDVFFDEKLNATWLYDDNHNSWKMVMTPSRPQTRYYSSMVYVSSIDRVLMYGGELVYGNAVGDLWSFDPKAMNWEELHSAVSPGNWQNHAMAYDSKADKVVLFGGAAEHWPWTNQTWIYDPHMNSWTDVTPKH